MAWVVVRTWQRKKSYFSDPLLCVPMKSAVASSWVSRNCFTGSVSMIFHAFQWSSRAASRARKVFARLSFPGVPKRPWNRLSVRTLFRMSRREVD